MDNQRSYFRATFKYNDVDIPCIVTEPLYPDKEPTFGYAGYIFPENFTDDMKAEHPRAVYVQFMAKKEDIEVGEPVFFSINSDFEVIYDESPDFGIRIPVLTRTYGVITIGDEKREFEEIKLAQ